MFRNTIFVHIAAIAIALHMLAFGQSASASNLLERGIYTQDTLGDLDGAIKIYRQVVSTGGNSTYTAQAQYRLAMCLLAKGDKAEAKQDLAKLIQSYPNQQDLVAKAQEALGSANGGVELLPAPWPENEYAEYLIRAGQLEVGASVYSVAPAENPRDLVMSTRTYAGAMMVDSLAEARRDTLAPVSASFDIPAIGSFKLAFSGKQLQITPKGKESKTVPVDADAIDNNEATFLLRRLPLAVGYKGTLTIASPVGAVVKVDFAVSAVEDLQVPAGKFHCFKVDLALVNQTVWVGTEPTHPIVQLQAGGATLVLNVLQNGPPSKAELFRDEAGGVTANLPAGWLAQPLARPDPEKSLSMAILLDSQTTSFNALEVKKLQTAADRIPAKLQSLVDDKEKDRKNLLPTYQVQRNTVQARTIGGQKAIGYLATYSDATGAGAEYLTFILTPSKLVEISSRAGGADPDQLKQRFDPIVDTVTVQ